MRRLLLASIALTALTGFSVPSFAEAQKFVLDKPHTQIIFNGKPSKAMTRWINFTRNDESQLTEGVRRLARAFEAMTVSKKQEAAA